MISRCALPNYKRIASLPTDQWADEIKALPAVCPHNDCSPGLNCTTAVRDLLAAK
jgi:hypothetical protein